MTPEEIADGTEPQDDNLENEGVEPAPEGSGDQTTVEEGEEARKPKIHKVKIGETEYDLDEERLTGRFKVKIDDEEGEVDTEELRRGYQRARASQKRFEEAALLRRDNQASFKRLAEDPIGTAIEIRAKITGSEEQAAKEVRNYVEQWLIHQLNLDGQSAEQKELDRIRRENERLKREVETKTQTQEQKALEARAVETEKEFTNQVLAGYRTYGLPDDRITTTLILPYLTKRVNGETDMSIDDICALVREERERLLDERLESLPDDEILKRKKLVDKVQKAVVGKIKDDRATQRRTPQTGDTQTSGRSKTKVRVGSFEDILPPI